jgi:hypothetical protein
MIGVVGPEAQPSVSLTSGVLYNFQSVDMQGSKYKNIILACHFIILLGALISYGLPSMYFRLSSVKFGLQFGH